MDRPTIVYLVTNDLTGKVYIGKTTRSLAIRRGNHLWDARTGSPRFFHRALRKYGVDSFTWETLTECPTEAQAFEVERYWIRAFKSNDPLHGYNQTNGGEGASGAKVSEKNKQKSRERMLGHKIGLGRKMSDYTKQRVSEAKYKKVICIEEGKVFASQIDAAEHYDVSNKVISSICLGQGKFTARGLHFRFYREGEEVTPQVVPPRPGPRKGQKWDLVTYQRHRESKSKRVLCVETGEVFVGLQAAADFCGLKDGGRIMKACHGKVEKVRGYHWQYLDQTQH
jgi:hypothetical protein